MVRQHFISKVNNNIDKVPLPLLHYGLSHWQLVIDLWLCIIDKTSLNRQYYIDPPLT